MHKCTMFLLKMKHVLSSLIRKLDRKKQDETAERRHLSKKMYSYRNKFIHLFIFVLFVQSIGIVGLDLRSWCVHITFTSILPIDSALGTFIPLFHTCCDIGSIKLSGSQALNLPQPLSIDLMGNILQPVN